MANKLFYFLVKMGEDIELQRRYHESEDSRDRVMDEFGLSATDKDVLVNGTESAIQEAVAGKDDDFVVSKNWKIRKNWKKPKIPPKK